MLEVVSIPLSKIEVGERLRAVDADWVSFLSQSIEVNGLQQAIMVAAATKRGGKYRLVGGAHRLNAVKALGWTEISATVLEGDELQLRLHEIDENLVRRELSPFDKATFLAERKEIYDQLHPETQQGAAGAAARWYASDKLSFASEVSAKLGISERDVQRSIARYRNIAPDVRSRIAGTWLANKGSELDALAKLGDAEQRQAIDLMLSGGENAPRNVKAAAQLVQGYRPPPTIEEDAEFEALLKAWRRGGTRARRRFLDHLVEDGAIDAAAIREAA